MHHSLWSNLSLLSILLRYWSYQTFSCNFTVIVNYNFKPNRLTLWNSWTNSFHIELFVSAKGMKCHNRLWFRMTLTLKIMTIFVVTLGKFFWNFPSLLAFLGICSHFRFISWMIMSWLFMFEFQLPFLPHVENLVLI